jgi:hypothetical protein
VLGLEYIRAMAAAGVGFCEAARGGARLLTAARRARAVVLCVGLGTGALPAFFAAALPATRVRVVEVDPVVTSVVRAVLRVPLVVEGAGKGGGAGGRGGVAAVRHGDAGAALAAEPPGGTTLIFLDAYDRAGEVPAHLAAPPFLRKCAAALEEGGCIVCNVWNGAPGSAARARAEAFCAALGDATGAAFTLKVAKQQSNLIVIGVKGGAGAGGSASYSRGALAAHARRVGAGWGFDPGAFFGALFAAQPLRGGGVGESAPGREGTSAVDLSLFTVAAPAGAGGE